MITGDDRAIWRTIEPEAVTNQSCPDLQIDRSVSPGDEEFGIATDGRIGYALPEIRVYGMKIERIIARPLKRGSPLDRGTSPRASIPPGGDGGNTLSRYREFSGRARDPGGSGPPALCLAIAGDGTWGMGITDFSGAVVPLINEYFAPMIEGGNALATERLWDLMFRHASVPGVGGIVSYAISAIDLALWDLKGKLLQRPVYELLGGPAHAETFCYATGHDVAWMLESGFEAVKLPCFLGEAQGIVALERIEQKVAHAREMIGPERELMLDCWVAGDVEFMVRLGERLRPYGLKWLEDYLYPEDFASYEELRRRLPWQTLATGERWFTHLPFGEAAARRTVDIFQPDVRWVGGVTACIKIGHIAEGAGLQVALHGGVNDSFGQHLCHAMPSNMWGELYIDSAPGIPLEEGWRPTPGMAIPKDGRLVPPATPGFGIELTRDELEAMTD
ncbi:MAG: mandelate racemase/muconate lactonizing enzyme family protein [bacterium]|nr:mandelate racemase/muconate lactonizing enzyme family protein [bacterium]